MTSTSSIPNASHLVPPHMKMGDAAITRLSGTPWCAALINDPAWTPTRTASRVPKPTSEDSFFAETLGTPRTIRSCLTLRPTEKQDGDMAYKEVRTIMELGDGLNGHPRICHGGFVATMLDEVLGVLITLDVEERMKRKVDSHMGMNYFTAYLNTSYRKPVPTPGVVLCTAKFVRRERNKLYVNGTVEDGHGTVYTVGEGMFAETRTKL